MCSSDLDAKLGQQVLHGVHRATEARCALAAHDCSEGGLAVAVAEMALGGRLGVRVDLGAIVADGNLDATQRMFSESQSRIVLEVPKDRLADLRANLRDTPHAVIGEVTGSDSVEFTLAGRSVAKLALTQIEQAWKRPLDLDGTLIQEVQK